MSDIITTLHPENDADTNLYPNIKKENIPNTSIGREKLSNNVNALLDSINSLHPNGTDTADHILAFTTNKGIYIGSDTGHWYYWNGSQYVDGGTYLSDNSYDEIRTELTNYENINSINLSLTFSGGDVSNNNGVIAYTSDEWNGRVKYHTNLFKNTSGFPILFKSRGNYVFKYFKVDNNGTTIISGINSFTNAINELIIPDDGYYYILVFANAIDNYPTLVDVVNPSDIFYNLIITSDLISYINNKYNNVLSYLYKDKDYVFSGGNAVNNNGELTFTSDEWNATTKYKTDFFKTDLSYKLIAKEGYSFKHFLCNVVRWTVGEGYTAYIMSQTEFVKELVIEASEYSHILVFTKDDNSVIVNQIEPNIMFENIINSKYIVDYVNRTKFDYTKYNLPIIYINGDLSNISHDTAVSVNYVYGELMGTCTLKWQGRGSLAFPRKNYTIKFDNSLSIVNTWGYHKKYVLKSNFNDYTRSRNIVGARLWGLMANNRLSENDRLRNTPNFGAIDGFPILMVINNEYQGIYTFNVPKEDWMMGMNGSSNYEAIVSAERTSDATKFKGLALMDSTDFEFEYVNEDYETVVKNNFNIMLQSVIDCYENNNNNWENVVGEYLDIDSAIDWYILTVLTQGVDNRYYNYLLSTFDGNKWFFTPYDMDITFGISGLADYISQTTASPTFKTMAEDNYLFGLIWKYSKSKLINRYRTLREGWGLLQKSNVMYQFSRFISLIPKPVYDEDIKIWPTMGGSSINDFSSIYSWVLNRFDICDDELDLNIKK